jgi:hypothetical protein
MTLIVGGVESRMVKATVEFEAAVSASIVQGADTRIERVRFEDGRWRKVALLLARLEALGCTIDMKSFQVGGRGPHSPVY